MMGQRQLGSDNANFLRKQRAAVQAISSDNLKLKEELMLENKFSVDPTSLSAASLIGNLQAQADSYGRKITEEQRVKAELQQQVDNLQARIADQRLQMGGLNNSKDQEAKVHRGIRILEDRVQQASCRHSTMMTRIDRLRAGINSLRHERLLFEALARKLQRGVAQKKADLAALILAISASDDEREKAVVLQGQVKAQAERDVGSAEAEWRELTEVIEQDRRLRDTKRQREVAQREVEMAALFKQDFSALIAARRSSLMITPAGGTHAAPTPATPAERLRQHQDMLARVLAATGAADVESLLLKLAAAEESNLGLFNYVSDLNGEVEKLEQQIDVGRRELELQASGARDRESDAYSMTLKELEAARAASEGRAAAYESRHGAALAGVEALRTAVLDMFGRTGCGTPAVLELLGGGGVTEANLVQYLGVLEQRINEIVQRFFVAVAPSPEAGLRAAAAVLGSRHAPGVEYVIEPPTIRPLSEGSAASSAAGAETRGGLGRAQRSMAPLAGPQRSHEGGGWERPLARLDLKARVDKVVATSASGAVMVKAPRPAASPGR